VERVWSEKHDSQFPSRFQSICLENSQRIPGRCGRSADYPVERLQLLLMWSSVEESNRIRGRWSRDRNAVTCKSTAHTNCRTVAFVLHKSVCLGKFPHPDIETWPCHWVQCPVRTSQHYLPQGRFVEDTISQVLFHYLIYVTCACNNRTLFSMKHWCFVEAVWTVFLIVHR